MILFLDLETFCEVPIKYGTYVYAEHCEIMIIAWAIDDGPVRVDDLTQGADLTAFRQAFETATEICAHNSQFDRIVLRQHGFEAPIVKWHCTLARAMAHSLPGSLDKLCDIMKVPVDKAKHKNGKDLVKLFCMPLPKESELRRATRETHPIEWAQFLDYAGGDVDACRVLFNKLPRWNYSGRELALYHLDQTINDRGIQVDVDLARAAIRAADAEKGRLGSRTKTLTLGGLDTTTRRDAFLEILLTWYGVELPDLQAGTIERRLDDPEIPDEVKELLRIRLMASRTTATKYTALLRGMNSDGRLRGLLAFCGALRTGRWAGRVFQPQNLMRTPKYLSKIMATVIDLIKCDGADLCFENVMEVLGAAARGAIIAAPGHELCCADLSNIEGRDLAWLAGEWWKLDAFRAFDRGEGHDIYVLGYSQSFGVSPEMVIEDDEAGGKMRLIGKVQELALGYQGALGAFSTMGLAYGIELDEGHVYQIVQAWRRANPAITNLWPELQDAAIRAITSPGVEINCGRLNLRRDGPWFRIRLPSGRYLCYPHPEFGWTKVRCRDCGGAGKIPLAIEGEEPITLACERCKARGWVNEEVISYMGTNQYTRKWERIPTYGGKLVENVVQASSRDVLTHNMALAESEGYKIVLSVHDELITEVPVNQGYTAEGLSEIMTTLPPWAEGLPLAAKGYVAERYRKG